MPAPMSGGQSKGSGKVGINGINLVSIKEAVRPKSLYTLSTILIISSA